jgi:transcriptional regulator with XRE-family HTH domain
MAKGWTQAQKDELAELIQMLFAMTPFRSWAEFAREAEVSTVSMSRWQTGQDALEGYNLLKLLRASGALEVLRAEAERRTQPQAPDRPQELEEVAAAMLEEVRRGFDEIRTALANPQTPAEPQSVPTAPRKRPA